MGEQQATVKAMTGVLHPWRPHFKYIKPGTIVTTGWDDMIEKGVFCSGKKAPCNAIGP